MTVIREAFIVLNCINNEMRLNRFPPSSVFVGVEACTSRIVPSFLY